MKRFHVCAAIDRRALESGRRESGQSNP